MKMGRKNLPSFSLGIDLIQSGMAGRETLLCGILSINYNSLFLLTAVFKKIPRQGLQDYLNSLVEFFPVSDILSRLSLSRKLLLKVPKTIDLSGIRIRETKRNFPFRTIISCLMSTK